MTQELPSIQRYLLMKVRHWAETNKYTIERDKDNYLQFNNGKRFYSFRFGKENKTFFGIREDGNTRYVFNGIVENFDDFKKIDYLTQ